jgi:hypothetical protein
MRVSVEPLRPTVGALGGALLGCALALGACSSEEDAALTEPAATPGIVYSASASETLIDGGYRLLVTLSIENTTVAPVTLTYPATCPIRIRLYRPSDNALVYDETRVPCASDESATLTLSPQTTRSLGSGFRRMGAIMGDSIVVASYRVVAVPRTEGARVLEISAGSVVLRP